MAEKQKTAGTEPKKSVLKNRLKTLAKVGIAAAAMTLGSKVQAQGSPMRRGYAQPAQEEYYEGNTIVYNQQPQQQYYEEVSYQEPQIQYTGGPIENPTFRRTRLERPMFGQGSRGGMIPSVETVRGGQGGTMPAMGGHGSRRGGMVMPGMGGHGSRRGGVMPAMGGHGSRGGGVMPGMGGHGSRRGGMMPGMGGHSRSRGAGLPGMGRGRGGKMPGMGGHGFGRGRMPKMGGPRGGMRGGPRGGGRMRGPGGRRGGR